MKATIDRYRCDYCGNLAKLPHGEKPQAWVKVILPVNMEELDFCSIKCCINSLQQRKED
jgi:hypothetical protein